MTTSHPLLPHRFKRSIVLVCGLLAALLALGLLPEVAHASPKPINPNPIDWTIEKVFYDQYGNDIPLRTGQEDYLDPKTDKTVDGFGRIHIEDSEEGHGVVPPSWDIQDAMSDPANCLIGPDRVWCTNPETSLLVVYNPAVDPRSGDSEAFGIITAYYTLACIVHGDNVHPDCSTSAPPTPTRLTYTGPSHGTNGEPLTLTAELTDDLGFPLKGESVHFSVGTGAAVQSCSGTSSTSGTAECSISRLHQAGATAIVSATFANAGFDSDSDSATLSLLSPTILKYTGPTHGINGQPLQLSAALTDYAGNALQNETIHFTIGSGDSAQSCDGTTATSGTAQCTIDDLRQRPTTVPLTARFAGDGPLQASSTSASLVVQSPTTLTYTGPTHLANGTSSLPSAVLKDYLGTPVAQRQVHFTVGTGNTTQSCDATTDTTGKATCTIGQVHQPLNTDATVPLHADFAGDTNYLPSNASATLLLEYFTGRAYGLSADLSLPLLPVRLAPQPDTGQIRTADASSTSPSCAGAPLLVLSVEAACPTMTTTLAPGTATATTTVAHATIGLPGVPVISVSALTATATSQCQATTGSTHLTLTVGGTPVTVPTAQNSTLALPGGTRLIINEQQPTSTADHGITVNALHVIAADGLGDVILGSASSAVHNCGA